MIHLDANYLIMASHAGTAEAGTVRRWLERNETLATSAIAWMEFATGPVSPDVVDAIRNVIGDRIAAFGQEESELAARLYNAAGRRRGLRYDAMIAAVAINAGAKLATANLADMRVFAPHGLELAH